MIRPERIALEQLLDNRNTNVVQRMVDMLNHEGVCIYPTETIYGIGGRVTPVVAEKIYQAKKRPQQNPLILIAADISHFDNFRFTMNRHGHSIASALWPGNVTLIVSMLDTGTTVGIRVSPHPFIRLINNYLPEPLYSTSANISNQSYCSDPDHIFSVFCSSIDFMIDAGVLPPSLPSTVIDVSDDDGYTIVREGVVSASQISRVVAAEEQK